MSLKCCVWQLFYVQISDNYVSIYTSYELTAINNVTESRYAYSFHYWHTPLNKYVSHTANIHPSALLLWSRYRSHITAYIHQMSMNCNLYLPYYCKICARNKYTPQKPNICHMPKFPNCLCGISAKTVGTIALESRPNSSTYARFPNLLYTAELST